MDKENIKKSLPVIIIFCLIVVFLAAKGLPSDSNDSKKSELTLVTENNEKSSDKKETTSIKDTETETESKEAEYVEYKFRNNKLLDQHYQKHGKAMGFSDRESYEKAASDVVNNKNALHKTEEEDGDDIYYVESTNEFVVVSTDGYLRTYFNPDRGLDYFNRQ